MKKLLKRKRKLLAQKIHLKQKKLLNLMLNQRTTQKNQKQLL